jgi:hypothetical protein
VDRLGSVCFYSPFVITSGLRLGCLAGSVEKRPGSLSVDNTVVSWANVAVIDSGDVGRYAVYHNGTRTLPWGTAALTEQTSVYSVSGTERKCLLCK